MLIPLKVDVPMWRRPLVNCALVLVIALVSIAALNDRGLLLELAGVIADEDGHGLSMSPSWATRSMAGFTSLFLHAGCFHLFGNLLFLWVFGNAINYKFGHLAYPALFLAAGWIGSMAHYAFTGRPVVGASGAINGVVGAFLVFFPRNDVTMLLWFGVFVRKFTVSSYWIILFWFAWDAFDLVTGGGDGVAVWSHVAGFVSGFAVAIACAATGLLRPTEDEQTLLEMFSPQRPTRRY